MKVAIIGAGIYGCHIAKVLLEFGIDVTIYEKNKDIFLEASGNNQFRLHQGYHYARDYETRNQSKLGFEKFMDVYSEFTREIDDNLYVIPRINSLIDFRTYLAIFSHEGFKFDLIKVQDQLHLVNIEGILNVSERVICTDALKFFFRRKLNNLIVFDCAIDELEMNKLKMENDFVIDCTWGKLSAFDDSFFELTHLAYCQNLTKGSHPAFTFVDGNLWSLYPTENSEIFTLSSVIHTPMARSKSLKDIQEIKHALSKDMLRDNFIKMACDVEYYYPRFRDNFKYVGDQVSIKTKIVGANDPRDCRVSIEDNVIQIFSGKIDTLYVAEEFILNKLL